jgi:hypothetical protein
MKRLSLAVEGGPKLGDDIIMASNPWLRFRGLMGTDELSRGSGMLFPHTNAVHGFFMRYPILTAYLDAEGNVLEARILKPWHVGAVVRKARYVLELPADLASIIRVGMRIVWKN